MSKNPVVIAGAGPTGLMLACELRLAGVPVTLLEALSERTGQSRAGGIHARTMEVLDQRGILEGFLEQGKQLAGGHFSAMWLDFSGFETRYPYLLQLLQARIETLLEKRAAELGVEVEWASEVTGFEQDADGIDITVRGPEGERVLRADYLVGCDGGRSTIRKAAGIGFSGTDASLVAYLCDAELDAPPSDRIFQQRTESGDFTVLGFEPGWYRLMVTRFDTDIDRDDTIDFEEFRSIFTSIAGTDYGMRSPRWISRFTDAARQADNYRAGRVLLAGDSAHIHFPAGGQGLNMGVQDAVNLGWKLAAVVKGEAPDNLLDSYEAERHPVTARVLQNTRAQSALNRPGPQVDALREIFGDLIAQESVNSYLGTMINGLDIRYPMTGDHPLLGLRMPDLDLDTADGSIRTYSLLHCGRAVLLDLTGDPTLADDLTGWQDRVDLVTATAEKRWTIPVLGEISAPAAVLIRPDGYVAWVSTGEAENDRAALTSALHTWFGPAR
ncbi:FAD-dependent monooxygenase [Nocardia sp. NPDC051030]|uniref:FAD-dependent monooxygenase n=1 Tax=Nocardia sp. NPDC051030 TaxID=3155162 RepID=UPI003433DA24